jgi:predicted nuclease of predicted toxin-antitoxin system
VIRSQGPPAATAATIPYRFLLDEDLSFRIAETARGLALDMVSVHEIGRRGLPDDEQLRWAAREGRILVTRNRDDFIEWTTVFFQRGEPHTGVLIVTTALSIQKPERIAHAVKEWAERTRQRFGAQGLNSYFIEFLSK